MPRSNHAEAEQLAPEAAPEAAPKMEQTRAHIIDIKTLTKAIIASLEVQRIALESGKQSASAREGTLYLMKRLMEKLPARDRREYINKMKDNDRGAMQELLLGGKSAEEVRATLHEIVDQLEATRRSIQNTEAKGNAGQAQTLHEVERILLREAGQLLGKLPPSERALFKLLPIAPPRWSKTETAFFKQGDTGEAMATHEAQEEAAVTSFETTERARKRIRRVRALPEQPTAAEELAVMHAEAVQSDVTEKSRRQKGAELRKAFDDRLNTLHENKKYAGLVPFTGDDLRALRQEIKKLEIAHAQQKPKGLGAKIGRIFSGLLGLREINEQAAELKAKRRQREAWEKIADALRESYTGELSDTERARLKKIAAEYPDVE